MKKEWGFSRFISLETFNEYSNGYLVEDCCVFGAEICVINQACKLETLYMVKEPENGIFTWKLENFSSLDKIYYDSEDFTVEKKKWYVLFCGYFMSSYVFGETETCINFIVHILHLILNYSYYSLFALGSYGFFQKEPNVQMANHYPFSYVNVMTRAILQIGNSMSRILYE